MNDTELISFIGSWIMDHGLVIIITIVMVWLIIRFSSNLIEKSVRKIIPESGFINPEAEKKREDTIIEIINGFVKIIVWIVAGLVIISEFGVPIGPVLTSLGIFGIAIGFGAQYIIRDIITGIFIVAENQYRIDDLVELEGLRGTVEKISLRVTRIRDVNGTVHYIPNGEIKKASNLSQEYSMVHFNIGVAYDSDIDFVEKVINEVGEEIRKDEKFSFLITEAPKFIRVDDFGTSEISLKIMGKVMPKKQFEVTGEMKKRLKFAFEKNNIEIPFPQQVIHYANKKEE